MGVIYSAGDDVADLLCPFVEGKGGTKDTSQIADLYNSASLGEMSASELWRGMGLDPKLEGEYLQRHKLTGGLIDFLEAVKARGWELWCLSNDLSEWSRKLRARFGLDKYFRGFVISGDVGVRKPDRAIFDYLVRQLEGSPSRKVFVDDQGKNLDTAAALGFDTILFAPASHVLTDEKHRVATTFAELLLMLS
jgi:HAD superfamily hydrolase (TIGR01509 family)